MRQHVYSCRLLWGRNRLCVDGIPRMTLETRVGWIALFRMGGRPSLNSRGIDVISDFLRGDFTPWQIEQRRIGGLTQWLPTMPPSLRQQDSFFGVNRAVTQ